MIPYSRYLFDKGTSLSRPRTLRTHGGFQGHMTSLVRHLSSSLHFNPQSWGVSAMYREEDLESVDSYLEKNPILYKVPTDRLISVNPRRPFMATENGKIFLWSAAFGTYLSHKQGVSTSGLFKGGSLGVWRPLGVLAVKDFTPENKPLTDDQRREDFDELNEYLTSLLQNHHGSNVLKLILPDMKLWLKSMKASVIDEDMIAFDPSLLPRKERGALCLDISTHLRKEMPLLDNESIESACDVLAEIPEKNELMGWRTKAKKNIFLDHWTTHRLRMMKNEKSKKQKNASDDSHISTRQGLKSVKASDVSVSNGNSSSTTTLQHKKTKPMGTSGSNISNSDNSSTTSFQRKKTKPVSVSGGNVGNSNSNLSTKIQQKFDSMNTSLTLSTKNSTKSKYRRKWKGRTMSTGHSNLCRRNSKSSGNGKSAANFNRNQKNQNEEYLMQQRKKVLERLGASLVDLHRNSLSHLYEKRLIMLIKKLSEKRRKSLTKKLYTVEEVLDLLHYEFPEYLPRVLAAIRRCCRGLWVKLDMSCRFPLASSLYRKKWHQR